MTNPRGMNQMIEIFFQVKFNTTYAKEDVKYDEIPEIKLGQPDQKCSEFQLHSTGSID